jgi:general stress protein 26
MHPYIPQSIRQLRKLLRGMPVGMLTTQTRDGETRSRPMLVRDVDDSGWLWFLTDRNSRKACDLVRNPHASITFQSRRGNRYVSVQGTAVVVQDDLRLKRMWSSTYRAWFPKGRRDPDLVLVAVRITRADYWIVPLKRVSRLVGAARSLVTGRKEAAGRHGVLELYAATA